MSDWGPTDVRVSKSIAGFGMANIFMAAFRYFATVFAIGFALAFVRVLMLEPVVGERSAEMIELPIMCLAVWWIAMRQFSKQRAAIFSNWHRVLIGLFALTLMLIAELGVVVWVRNESLYDYVQSRDPVAGSLYLLSLALFAALPWMIGFRKNGDLQTINHKTYFEGKR